MKVTAPDTPSPANSENSQGVRPAEQGHSLLSGSVIRVLPTGIAVGGWRSDLVAHRAMWNSTAPRLEPHELISWVREIELTGRGGGHFPAAMKIQSAIDSGPGGIVVVNAAEGEPASAKDAVLWQCRPHLVLDGACAVAQAIGAREIVVWLHAEAVATRISIEQAIGERAAAGITGPPVRLLFAPEGYVSGESSAVIAGVRGLPVAPIFVANPARPWGDGPAILVHNTETMARIGALSHTGIEHYPMTSLITVAQPITPGREYERIVLEVSDSCTLAEAIHQAGFTDVHAILLGGFAGTWLSMRTAQDLFIDQHHLRAHGLSLGAGIIIALGPLTDVLTEASAIADYLADSSAGQCGPCIFGMPAVAKSFRRRRLADVIELSKLIEGRGGCRMPDGAIRMIRSAMELHASPTRETSTSSPAVEDMQ